MTMEEVASEENLRRAFGEVAQNRGAPGPDGRSIAEVRAHLDKLLPVLRRHLLDGTYRPGMIRRVWIPKPGGGERGLDIPDVGRQVGPAGGAPRAQPTLGANLSRIEPWFRRKRSTKTVPSCSNQWPRFDRRVAQAD
jgi:hypothetical protein